MNKEEFYSLVSGRIHYAIERDHVRVESSFAGKGPMQTGEHRIILSITGISKDKLYDNHIVRTKINMGVAYPKSDEYTKLIEEAEEYVKEHFPDATRGAFSYE